MANVTLSVLATQVQSSHSRGRPKLRWMDRLKEDIKDHTIHPKWASDRGGGERERVRERERERGRDREGGGRE